MKQKIKNNNKSKAIKKNILLISYHFPPSIAVGGLRIANFAKNLPLFGWNTYVLTIRDHYLKKVDTEKLKDIKGVKIYKTVLFPTILSIYLRLKTAWYGVLRKRRVSMDELTSSYVQPNLTPYGSEKISQKLRRYLVTFLTRPDLEINWILPAVLRAIKVIKREKIDCILTSCPPYSVHLIGLLARKITGVKWVADFRDPWVTTVPEGLYVNCALYTKLEGWLEKKVVQVADIVLTTTEKLCSTFKESYKKQLQNKFLCITNGFDTEIFSKIEHLNKYDNFTLSYTGTLYLGRSPKPVFRALKELVLEGKLNLQNIRVKLVGNCQYIDGYPIAPIIHSYGLDSVVEVIDSVPYLRSLEIIMQSHLALLFAPDQPFQIPAKAFDYIGSGTKILAIAGEGATSDLINSTGAGESFYPSDIQGIKEFISRSITNRESFRAGLNSNIVRKFDRKLIAQNLAKHLSSII